MTYGKKIHVEDSSLLTIIIPVYNAEKYIVKCLDSILGQTFCDYRLIIIDDGSTDDSGVICDRYSMNDDRITVIHQSNKGKVYARYLGLKNADSKYVTFVDADDWIDKNTYSLMAEYMNSDIDMISFSLCRYYSDTNIQYSNLEHDAKIFDKTEISSDLINNLIWIPEKRTFGIDPSLCNKIVKRKLMLEEYKKTKSMDLTIGEDAAVVWPLFKRINSFYLSNTVLYYHRQRTGEKVAPYISDESYNYKLVQLYDYLMGEFADYPSCKRQIDFFFAEYAGFRLRIYGEKLVKTHYLFPFDKVKKGGKIILYGAGDVGKSYYKQIKETGYCDVIAWLDQKKSVYLSKETLSPDCIQDFVDYDHVVIGIASDSLVQSIKGQLVEYGVDDSSIVWKIIEL